MAPTNPFQRRRGLSRIPAVTVLPAAPDRGYASLPLVGPPPDVRSRSFDAWGDRLLAQRLANVPSARDATVCFAQSGNDLTGDGSPGNPYRTLAWARGLLLKSAGNYGTTGLNQTDHAYFAMSGSDWCVAVWVFGTPPNNFTVLKPGEWGVTFVAGPKPSWVVVDGASTGHTLNWPTALGAGWHLILAGFDSASGLIWLSVDGAAPVTQACPSTLADTATSLQLFSGVYGSLAMQDLSFFKLPAGTGGVYYTPQFRADLWNGGTGRRYERLPPAYRTGLLAWYKCNETVLNGFGLHDALGLHDVPIPDVTYPMPEAVGRPEPALRVNFRRGDLWREATPPTMTRASVTLGDYGAGPKPVLSRFTRQYASGWVSVSGNLWKRAEAVAVGWVKRIGDDFAPFAQILSRQDTSAHVGGLPSSWFYDSAGTDPNSSGAATLYLNPGAGVNPNTSGGYEACPADALQFLIQADNVRLENLVTLGCGLNSLDTGATYGIQFDTLGASGAVWECVLSGVDVFYTGYHAVGSSGDNNVLTCSETRGGLCTLHSFDGTPFVGFAGGGGQELFLDDCEVTYGALPDAAWAGQASSGRACSSGVLMHVAGGTLPALGIVRNMAYPDTPWQTIRPSIVSGPADGGSLSGVRAFVIGERPAARGMAVLPGCYPNVCHVNCRYDYGAVSPNPYLWSDPGANGWALNCTLVADATGRATGWSVLGNQTGGSTLRWYNCHFDAKVGGLGAAFFDATAAPAAGTTVQNSVVAFADVSGTPRGLDGMGTVTNVGLSHNGYCLGLTASYASDPAPVALGAEPAVGARPARGSPLYGAGVLTTPRLEYDQLGNQRRPDRADLGPVAGW